MLAEIRRVGATSRADLVEAIDLSPGAVSTISAELIERGLVRETGASPSPNEAAPRGARGRPRVALEINPHAAHFIGAKLNDRTLTVGVMNFSGELLASETVGRPSTRIDINDLARQLDGAIDKALAHIGLPRQAITALGFGVPGYVELESGLLRWSPFFEGAPIELKRLLEDHLRLPVHVDNDANLATLAELWFGYGRAERNFLTVTVEHGVGLGVVIDGALFRGGRGLGAEFGHTKVQYEGALCRCGQRGCLEAYVADYAIAREATAVLSRSPPLLSDEDAMASLAKAATAGDEVAKSIFDRAGRMLGLGLANLANIFDPAMIILTGARMMHHHLMAEEMALTLRQNSLRTGRSQIQPVVHKWGDELWARGAGALAIDRSICAV
ncbi:MAG: ROK family transcriptional regulator [Pseudomonadota bacterium]